MLTLLDAKLSDDELRGVSEVLESYLLRRAVCGLPTKNYNRVFLQLTRSLQEKAPTAVAVKEQLSKLTGESAMWPKDELFWVAWSEKHAYQTLNNPKIVHILRRLSDSYLEAKTERLTIEGQLTVEHILPQNWYENWPLEDGSRWLSRDEWYAADLDDPRDAQTHRRNEFLQTFGNLTIITQPLNSSVSNSAWTTKKPELLKASLLPINQQLHGVEIWDEKAIDNRGRELFERALTIWSGPGQA